MDRKFLGWILFFFLAGVWGSSFILMKRGLQTFSSQQVAALRIFVAFLAIIPFAFTHLRKEHLKYWKAFAVMGILGNFIPAFLFTKAETVISSALAGMLNSLTPLFTLLFGFIFFGVKPSRNQVIGISMGFAGAIGLLINVDANVNTQNSFWYAMMVVVATVFYGISLNTIRKNLQEVNAVTATVWAMSIIGPMAGAYLFSTDFTQKFVTMPKVWSSLGYVCILGIVGTSISVIFFNILIKQSGVLFASSVTYLIPVVAVFWGVADGENIQLIHFLWISIILTGVYLVNRKTYT